jgi:CheY-like chemotaxis protein
MAFVLIIEDNESSRFVIRSVIEHAGYDVLEAASTLEAARICANGLDNVLAVVADATLGTLSGWEIVADIRRRCPDMPILFVSGYPMDHLVERGLLGGHEDFLQKPFKAATLISEIERLVSQRTRAAGSGGA